MIKQQLHALNPALGRLDELVGEWEMVASSLGQPLGHGRVTFEWLEGGAFLVRREDIEASESLPVEMEDASPFPTNAIIGLDESTGQFTMLYTDARGVCRVVHMILDDGVWKMWRQAPGFYQRFTGAFNADANTITGRWEKSGDGIEWENDFDLSYTKIK